MKSGFFEYGQVSHGADDTLRLPFERRLPHPTSPGSSVATFTKTQLRRRALTTTVSTAVTRTSDAGRAEDSAAIDRQHRPGHPFSLRIDEMPDPA
jgi:hypothetical protein